MFGHPDVRLADAVRARHRVLEQLDDGRVGARRHDLAQNGSKVFELGGRGDALGHVHVHLVAVKVRVIGARGRHVQAEGGVGQHLDAVALHRALVERGLAVKEHHVAVYQVPVDDVALLNIYGVWVHELEAQRPIVLLEKD